MEFGVRFGTENDAYQSVKTNVAPHDRRQKIDVDASIDKRCRRGRYRRSVSGVDTGNQQLAQCWFPRLAISNAEI